MVLRMESSVAITAGRSKVALGHGGDKAIAMNHGNEKATAMGHGGDKAIAMSHGNEKAIAMGHGGGKRLPWTMEIKANDTDHGDGKAIAMGHGDGRVIAIGDRCQISDPPDATNHLGRDFISQAELLAILPPSEKESLLLGKKDHVDMSWSECTDGDTLP